jgi:hypothetical protein
VEFESRNGFKIRKKRGCHKSGEEYSTKEPVICLHRSQVGVTLILSPQAQASERLAG